MKLLLRVHSQQRRKMACGEYISKTVRKTTISSEKDPTHISTITKAKPKLDLNYRTHSITILLVSTALLAGFTLAAGLYINKTKEENWKANTSVPQLLDDVSVLPGGRKILDRETWGAIEPSEIRTLSHPVCHVIITDTGKDAQGCADVERCSEAMRSLQKMHIHKTGQPDLGYNFVVGGDANIYIGRGQGWDAVNTYRNNTIVIAFLGDYTKHAPTVQQMEAAKKLLEMGVTIKKLTADYKITVDYDSTPPGTKLYGEIAKWSHWVRCEHDDNIKCVEVLDES